MSGRAAHETTLAGLEARPGARHLYGEVRCEAIERLQREALDAPRPEVVVRVDRSGLNDAHPLVKRLYAAIERFVRPIVEAEERRAGARLVRAGKEIAARDEVGLRALNDAHRAAFDAPARPGSPAAARASNDRSRQRSASACRRRDGARRRRSTLRCASSSLRSGSTPASSARSRSSSTRRASRPERRSRSPPTPGSRSGSGGRTCPRRSPAAGRASAARCARSFPSSRVSALRVRRSRRPRRRARRLIVRHHASGWVREIARKDEDSHIEAEFDPEAGVVTVYEGRREFKALERAARNAGLRQSRVREYVPYRMLEVEVAANAVYSWAAARILERRLPGERPAEPGEFAAAVHMEGQLLRHRAHDRLMKAFLGPEVFEGTVTVAAPPAPTSVQLRLG